MHPYATDSEERRQVPLGLAVLAILSAYGLAWFLNYTKLQDRLWMLEIPSVAGFYGLYWWLFDRWVWRWSLLRTLNVIDVPDLNGHWKGTGESSYKDPNGNRTKFNPRWTPQNRPYVDGAKPAIEADAQASEL